MLTVPFWGLRDERARRLTRLGVVLLLFVVVLNRRTVWLALLAGVAVVMLRNRRLGRRAVVTLAGAAAVTAGVYLALPGFGRESGPVTSSGTGTLDWRVEGWQALLETWSKDPVSWLIGQPFGIGFARRVEGMEVVLEAHNFYLTTLLRTGAVGLVALIVLTGGLLRVLWRAPVGGSGGLLGADVFPALLVMQLIWLVTWTPGIEQGIITGLAVALATARVRGSDHDYAVSTVDPRARHALTASGQRRDGNKPHIAAEPGSGPVTEAGSCRNCHGNGPVEDTAPTRPGLPGLGGQRGLPAQGVGERGAVLRPCR